jgi:Outer membrane protein beta-barrel domain
MRRVILCISVALALCVSSWGQERPYEVTVQGSGFFSNDTKAPGLANKPTSSGGALFGFRLNATKWFALEVDYDYFRNSQKYFGAAAMTSVATNVHGVSGSVVFKIPTTWFLRPYALVGGAMMIFGPRSSLNDQMRGAFVYGGGFDVPLMKRVSLRTQYRGLVYSVPDFDINALRVDKLTHTAVPSLGFVFDF